MDSLGGWYRIQSLMCGQLYERLWVGVWLLGLQCCCWCQLFDFDYLFVIEVGGGCSWGPSGTGIFENGSGDCFVRIK